MGYSPWGHKESDPTEQLTFSLSQTHTGQSDVSQYSGRTLSLPTPNLTEPLGQAPKAAQGAKPLPAYSLGLQGLA